MVLDLELHKPHIRFKESFLAALDEFEVQEDKTDWIYMGPQEPTESPAFDFKDYLQRLLATEHTAQPHFVTTTTYWGIHKGQVVGRIGIRHVLDASLKRIGGHIGYIVRPSFRRKRVATTMLALTLKTAPAKKIGKLLLTCSEKNIASENTIVRNGGVFESIVNNPPHPREKRFWIDLE